MLLHKNTVTWKLSEETFLVSYVFFFFLSWKASLEETKTSCRIVSVYGSVQQKQGNFPREIFPVFLPIWCAPLQPI